MSLSRDCAIVEHKKNQWYLLLATQEHGEISDRNTTCDGPFASQEKAEKYLFDNYSNPGSLNVYDLNDRKPAIFERLIKSARKPDYRPNWF